MRPPKPAGKAGKRRSRSSSKSPTTVPVTRSQSLRNQALLKAPPCDGATTSAAATPHVEASTRSRRGLGPGRLGIKKPGPRKRITRASKAARAAAQNRKVTDYFPVRRSTRKNRGELRTEARIRLNELIKSGKEEGMRVGLFDGKGRGVITTRPFRRGDYVVEYHGDLIDLALAKKREARYAKDPTTGCYMYYFHYRSKGYCVDATKETGRLGRLINHSKSGNCQTKLHAIDGVPHLIVIATRDIEVGEELLYDYGDRSKASLEAYPWLKY